MMPALPAAVTTAPAGDEIVVTGRRGGYALDGRRLRAAQQAFAADRARFAPAAQLLFEASGKNGAGLEGLAVTLIGGDRRIPVPIGRDGRFTLPPLDAGSWTLVANRAAGQLGLRAWVLSPGATEADRLIGDYRLQCRVSWALRKDRYSLVQRAGFAAIGGCESRRIAFFTAATHPVEAARLDGARAPLEVSPGGLAFRVPLADRTVPNDAHVRLAFAAP